MGYCSKSALSSAPDSKIQHSNVQQKRYQRQQAFETERFLSVTKWHLSETERFRSVAKRPLSESERSLSVAERFRSITERFLIVAEWFLSVAKRFLSVAEGPTSSATIPLH
ncbi:hypothetical protein DN752_02080 [Echinicola strongylocentroti]|uniref:Uncharacterized protein n=1 Tax=Echinicola strongylocentroti TaxID=1795355 RepID=A0A2Z4IDV1_9BACT|nr:hypothetical protein [Echinicola strongylocentroti]AWW29020.1 hypothetical protein DN752_02080 [Echinicola strongylocentroti]